MLPLSLRPRRRPCLGAASEEVGVYLESARSLDLSRSEHHPVTPLSPEGTGFAARVPMPLQRLDFLPINLLAKGLA